MDYNLTPIEANYRVVRKAGIWITEMLWFLFLKIN